VRLTRIDISFYKRLIMPETWNHEGRVATPAKATKRLSQHFSGKTVIGLR